MKHVSEPDLTFTDRVLAAADGFRGGAVWRVVLGFAAAALSSRASTQGHSEWTLITVLVTALILLRVVPAALRRSVRFSASLQRIWAERRQIAKRYDSYQWQKVLWIGIGISLHSMCASQGARSSAVISAVCLVCGGIGLVRWSVQRSRKRIVAKARDAVR